MRKNCLAKALYDNIAESPEELAFRRGDVLTVLEQNPGDLEGWWLCSLRGRQGIAPGNRLRLLPGMYDPTGLGYGILPQGAGSPTIHAGTFPGPGHRRSWHVNPNRVVTPQKFGDVYLYNIPANLKAEEYDVPLGTTVTRPITVQCDTPVPIQTSSPYPQWKNRTQSAYDEPRPHNFSYDTPRPSTASFSDTSSTEPYDIPKIHDYDVPEADSTIAAYDIPGPPREVDKSTNLGSTENDAPPPYRDISGRLGMYDVPVSGRSSGVSLMSTSSSSVVSPASSQSSLNTSLSLSSLCGSNRSSLEQQSHEMYDIPPSGPKRMADGHSGSPSTRVQSLGMVPPAPGLMNNSMTSLEFYDVPTNNAPAVQFYDTPPKKAAPAAIADGVYDVPPQVTRDVPFPKVEDEVDSVRRLSSSSSDSRGSRDYVAVDECKELHLDRDAALELLVKAQQEVQSSITKLFSYTHSTWRKQENIKHKLYDIQVTCHKIRTTLKEFLSFAQGALANSAHAEDKKLYHKLARLIKPLVDSYAVVQSTTQALDESGWQISKLLAKEDCSTPDELDQLIACARGLTDDVQHVASFIQGNSTLIFKRSPLISDAKVNDGTSLDSSTKVAPVQERPLPPPPAPGMKKPLEGPEEGKEWVNDYDYVNLESKEAVERENEEIKKALPAELGKSFDELVKQSQLIVESDIQKHPPLSSSKSDSTNLDQSDLQILLFYGAQIDTHILFLTNAIDAFLATIENNQPPKIFIGHSKFVVISAHKLVYMGDTIYRNILNQEIKTQVMQYSNNLCESLKVLVNNTKKAALQFPSVAAVQEMVDSIVDVSHVANELKVVVTQAAKR